MSLKTIRQDPGLPDNKFVIFFGLFFISCASLALEVTLTRLLSVVTWYHLAFFAVSTAMLGMTAGSVTVYLKPNWFSESRLLSTCSKAALIGAVSILFSLVMLLLIPLTAGNNLMSQLALLAATIFCFLPFYFSGIVISGILTQSRMPIGKLYASDLAGAALGCFLVLLGLEVMNAPSLIIICGAICAFSAVFFSIPGRSRGILYTGLATALLLLAFAVLNTTSSHSLSPIMIKGQVENPATYVYEKWNSFSRVVVYRKIQSIPQLWSPSPTLPKDEKISLHALNIDGEAGTAIRKFQKLDDISHLRFDATNLAYFLTSPDEPACIIGVGGGKDIHSAIYFERKQIVGIDVNPIFINLLKGQFRDFAGIADYPGVKLVVDEARSYLTNTSERFGTIQMSLIDTWAATGAGAYTLTENSLYTMEAWKVFTSHLTDDGIFSVSRWYNKQNLGETGRVVSLALATLIEEGVEKPADHIVMITSGNVSTLLISKKPFSVEDLAKLRQVTTEMQYQIEIIPGTPAKNEFLRKLLSATSLAQLNEFAYQPRFNFTPPTDESPYFFNILRLESLGTAFDPTPGVITGNLTATATLVRLITALFAMTIVVIVVPLGYKTSQARKEGKKTGILWSGAMYFSLIGASFMLLEIALVQRFSVFLSHPVYALGVLLFTIIASSGLGSYLSEKLPLDRKPWAFLYPVFMAVVIVGMKFLLPVIFTRLMVAPMATKIIASVFVIGPMGIIMGCFFPTGMRITRKISNTDTPWYWALNGIFGVLCSALAVFISIFIGISINFYISAALYLAVIIPIYDFYRRNALK
jgi:hypothetical protein